MAMKPLTDDEVRAAMLSGEPVCYIGWSPEFKGFEVIVKDSQTVPHNLGLIAWTVNVMDTNRTITCLASDLAKF